MKKKETLFDILLEVSDETKLKMSLAKKNKQFTAGIKCKTLSADHK